MCFTQWETIMRRRSWSYPLTRDIIPPIKDKGQYGSSGRKKSEPGKYEPSIIKVYKITQVRNLMRKYNIAWTALTSHLTGMKRNLEQISAHYGCYLNKMTLQSNVSIYKPYTNSNDMSKIKSAYIKTI